MTVKFASGDEWHVTCAGQAGCWTPYINGHGGLQYAMADSWGAMRAAVADAILQGEGGDLSAMIAKGEVELIDA